MSPAEVSIARRPVPSKSSTFFTQSIRSGLSLSGPRLRPRKICKDSSQKTRGYASPASTPLPSPPRPHSSSPASSATKSPDILSLVLEIESTEPLSPLDKKGNPIKLDVRVLNLLDVLAQRGEKVLKLSKDSREAKVSLIKQIGTRMQDLLAFLETAQRPSTVPIQLLREQCWRIQSDAFRGVVSEGRLHPSTSEMYAQDNQHVGIYLAALHRSFLAYHLHSVAELAALRLLLPYWNEIFGRKETEKPRPEVDGVARMALDMSREISPDELTRVLGKSKWKPEDMQRISGLVLEPLCVRGRSGDGLRLYKLLLSTSVTVATEVEALLIRALVQDGQTQVAAPMLAGIERRVQPSPVGLPLLEAGLALYAKLGNTEKAEAYLSAIQTVQPRLRSLQISWILQAYAIADRLETVTELFQKFFNSNTGRRPTPAHYMSVLRAHQIRGDVDGWIQWFERAKSDGVPMKTDMLNAKLSLLAGRGDVEGVEMTLREMDALKQKGDLITYTILVAMFARRNDPVSAEQIVRRAISEGISPDGRLVGALIHAYVKAGSLDELVRIFDYLEGLPQRSHSPRYSAPVLEAVLKAHVAMAAPLSSVLNIFRKKMRSYGLRPSSRAYALVIQSACDADKLDVARSLIRDLDEGSRDPKSGLILDWRAPTILMVAYLRLGQKKRARALFEGMRRRGIPVNSTVLSHILQSIIDEDTQDSLVEAERFLDHFMTDPSETAWMEDPKASVSPVQAVLVPVMQAYAERCMPEKVRELLEQIIQVGGTVTLTPFNILLDAYRRANDVDMVKKVWNEIFRKAADDGGDPIVREITRSDVKTRRHARDMLVVPLSIVIDALSAAGDYKEIVIIWKAVERAGFGFDSGNWNSLVMALIRAGDVDQAFRAMSATSIHPIPLAPPDSEANASIAHTLLPNLDAKDPISDTSVVSSPLNTTRRRAETASFLKASQGRRVAKKDQTYGETMRILESHKEQRSSWRPFAATTLAMRQVLERLSNGYLLLPVQPGESSGTLASYDPPEAARLLAHIQDNYAQVVEEVQCRTPSARHNLQRKSR
ncbi:hypothetical protein FRB97_007980 [Tulasnella sp. 331]|nr:hypothetical protein FRB97_007980 [Tulasnella sp. 331]